MLIDGVSLTADSEPHFILEKVENKSNLPEIPES